MYKSKKGIYEFKRRILQYLLYKTKIASDTPTEQRKEFDLKVDTLIKTNIPKSLFKFYSFEKFNIDSLNDSYVYLNTSQNFNDIFDSCFYIDDEKIENKFLRGLLEREAISNYQNYCNKNFPQDSPFINSVISKIKSLPTNDWRLFIASLYPQFKQLYTNISYKAEDYIKTNPKLTCFTEDVYSILMWSHYADKHNGYALEFDFSNIQNNCTICRNRCRNEHYLQLYPVIYSDKRFEATDFVMYYLNLELQANNLFKIPVFNDDIYSIYKILLQKNKDWEYEKEWRLITTSTNCNFNRIIKTPKAIYIGVNATREANHELLSIAKRIKIPVYKMNYDYSTSEYKMNTTLLQKGAV